MAFLAILSILRVVGSRTDFLAIFAVCSDQPLAEIKATTYSSRHVTVLLILLGIFLTQMYKAVLISHLTKAVGTDEVNSFEDVIAKGLKIIVRKGTFYEDRLLKLQNYEDLKDSIILSPSWSEADLAEEVLEGKMVIFDSKRLYARHMSKYMKATNCLVKAEDFHFTTGDFNYMSPMMRKGHPLLEPMNLRFVQLAQFGLIQKLYSPNFESSRTFEVQAPCEEV